MCDLMPLTNAGAARMIASALSGCGGNDAILASVRASVSTAHAATEAPAVNAQAVPAAKSPAGARAATPANDRFREHRSARWLLAVV